MQIVGDAKIEGQGGCLGKSYFYFEDLTNTRVRREE